MTLEARNDALKANPNLANGRSAAIHITTRGSDWYWAVCGVMAFSTLLFIGHSFTKPRPHRLFHYITAGITLVAAIAYFTMAANLGWAAIDVEFLRSDHRVRGANREIFYVRYIDWFITTPLLLLDLLLTAALPWPTILWAILLDLVMIVCGLVGALVTSRYKWGYFAFGCAAFSYIFYLLVWQGRRHASALGSDVGRVFLTCGSITTIVWLCYPIAWGLAEGGNVIAPDSEAIFYGVLDIIAKPVFGALLIWGHRNIDPGRLGIHILDYSEDAVLATAAEKRRLRGNGQVANGTHSAHGTDATPAS